MYIAFLLGSAAVAPPDERQRPARPRAGLRDGGPRYRAICLCIHIRMYICL